MIHFDLQKTCMLLNGTNNGKFEGYEKTNHPEIINKGLKGLISEQKVDVYNWWPSMPGILSCRAVPRDKNSMQDDYRNYLFESFVKVVDAFKPKVFVFENVPGILGAALVVSSNRRIYDAFKNIGYKIRKPEELKRSQFTASDFGVPQKEKE